MATVQTICNRAVRLLGKLASNTNLGTNESADALVALNGLIDSWRNEELMCYARQTESLTLSASDASYTIGSGGDLNTTRPVTIEAAWYDDGSGPRVRVIEDAEYDAIVDKTADGDYPDRVNYRATMSTGTLYVYPVPTATRTLKLRTRIVVSAFSAMSDAVTLPPGWEEALAYNLAIELAPEYQMEPSGAVMSRAVTAKAGIKRVNARPITAATELVVFMGGGRSNIQTGE